MANALYGKGKEKILSGAINFLTDTIKCSLVRNDYAQSLNADEFLAVAQSSLIGTAQVLGTKEVTLGVFNAADITFAAVTAGSVLEGVLIYKEVTDASDSPLLAYIDTITGFPLTTNGGDITIQWDNGAYKIFSL